MYENTRADLKTLLAEGEKIREEITPENRISTLEQAEVYVKAVENFMEDMELNDNTKYDHSLRRPYNKKNEWNR